MPRLFYLPLVEPGVLLSLKAARKWVSPEQRYPYLRQSCGTYPEDCSWQSFRRQLAQGRGTNCTPAHRRKSGCACDNCVDDDSRTNRAVASSGGSRRRRNSPRRAHVPDQREGYHLLLSQVVSKCALRVQKRKAPGFPEALNCPRKNGQ